MPDPNFYSDYYISTTNSTGKRLETKKKWFIESGIPIAAWLDGTLKQLALGNWQGEGIGCSTSIYSYY